MGSFQKDNDSFMETFRRVINIFVRRKPINFISILVMI